MVAQRTGGGAGVAVPVDLRAERLEDGAHGDERPAVDDRGRDVGLDEIGVDIEADGPGGGRERKEQKKQEREHASFHRNLLSRQLYGGKIAPIPRGIGAMVRWIICRTGR